MASVSGSKERPMDLSRSPSYVGLPPGMWLPYDDSLIDEYYDLSVCFIGGHDRPIQVFDGSLICDRCGQFMGFGPKGGLTRKGEENGP